MNCIHEVVSYVLSLLGCYVLIWLDGLSQGAVERVICKTSGYLSVVIIAAGQVVNIIAEVSIIEKACLVVLSHTECSIICRA